MSAMRTGTPQHRTAILWRMSVYVLLIASPLIIRRIFGGSFGAGILTGGGLVFGLTGFAILALQPVLSARFRWVERPLGLDRLLRFHRVTGMTGAILVLAHPILLALGRGSGRLLLSLDLPLPLMIAKATVFLLLIYAISAVFRARLRIPFQTWFRAHSWLAPLVLAGIFLHSYMAAVRFQPLQMRLLWFGLLGTGLYSHWHLAIWRRLGGRIRPWKVGEVSRVTHDVWDIQLVPPAGKRVFDYLPGQFLFVTLLRGRGLPAEEHPFTISSSPVHRDSVRITPKESGDYTSTIGQTREGDRAVVIAPYGRFSFTLDGIADRLVFIAGGIGITPMMSMLRFLRDTGDDRKVLLVYANRTAEDIAFREELQAMVEGPNAPSLEIINVLSRPDPSWEGETGYVDGERLRKMVSSTAGSVFYVCGPPPMMRMVEGELRAMGVSKKDIHMERFSL